MRFKPDWLHAWTHNALALLTLGCCFVACAVTLWAFKVDAACRDAASPVRCRQEYMNSDGSGEKPLKKIYIAAGLVPPNMRVDHTGREADIIIAALTIGDDKAPAIKKEQIQFIVEPFGRHWFSYEADTRFDAVTTVPDVLELKGHKSDYYIMYRNGIGSLPTNGAPIETLEQLKDKRVVSFPGASRVVPEIRSQPLNYFSLYLERQDQRDHSLMLFNHEVNAVIADAMVFSYYNQALLQTHAVKAQQTPVFVEVFAPTCYRLVFRDATYRDKFDSGLKTMIKRGLLRHIDDDYTKAMNLTVGYIGAEGKPKCSP